MIQDFKNMEYTNITTKENVYYKIKQNIHKSSPQSCVKYYTMFYRSLIDQT